MIRSALILALLVPLGIHPQYMPAGPVFPTATVLNPCLVAGWPINEGSGRILHDISGNSNTANTNVVSPAWGSNAGFPGSSWTVGVGGAPATNNTLTNFGRTSPFSLAAWVSITSTSANQVILSDLQSNPTYNGWEITTESLPTNKLEFSLSNTASSNRIYVHGSTAIANTGKHYVVATYDGSGAAAGVKLYVDGTAETVTVDQNNLTGSPASTAVPTLGSRPADGNTMSGILAAAAIYNCVLTPTQISTYNARGVQVN